MGARVEHTPTSIGFRFNPAGVSDLGGPHTAPNPVREGDPEGTGLGKVTRAAVPRIGQIKTAGALLPQGSLIRMKLPDTLIESRAKSSKAVNRSHIIINVDPPPLLHTRSLTNDSQRHTFVILCCPPKGVVTRQGRGAGARKSRGSPRRRAVAG